MIRRSAFIALARVAAASFFLTTSLYCLLTYNAFAYQQFLRPHLISALTDFTVYHALLYWIVLLITALTLLPSVSRVPMRHGVWIYLGVSGAIGVWLFVSQVLPQVETSQRSLVLALAALVLPIWLALIDHRSIGVIPTEPSDGWRLLKSAVFAAFITWAIYAVAAPFRTRPSGVVAVSMSEFVLGSSSSLIAHLAVFVVIVLVALTLRELAARGRAGSEYWLLVGASAAAVALIVLRVIFAPIAFRGPAAWAVAGLMGALAALTWSAIARYRRSDAPGPRPTAMDLWMAPFSSSGSSAAPLIGLLLVPPMSYLLTRRAAIFDWNFMLQELIALAVWLATFALVHAATSADDAASTDGRGPVLVVPLVVLMLYGAEAAAIPRLSDWLEDSRFHADFILDSYAAVDPSYKLIRETLTTDAGADPNFYAYLRANSTIRPSVPVAPANVDFVRPLGPAAGYKPHIFFFIIDSLRPDYVKPYNLAVTFTPRFDQFAGEPGTYLFKHAFSRYGGTGLSVPSIWAGGMILHKEYVTPFAPMNALEKLIRQNDYQWFMTKDHISELFTPSPAITWLDRDVPEMEHTFCGTMRELEADLRARPAGAPPVFGHTRPLDLHVSKVRSAVAPPGESYPGFSGAYAARVHRIDACFGEFVDALKEVGLYGDSVIVVMSDHGDSLGEEQRWGHAYTLFPEVMRIPLIVHLPPRLDGRLAADLGRVSFSIDVVPTLYALLGYEPDDLGPLFGTPLFDKPGADWSRRRRESQMVVSSYGAVYGLFSQNGRMLYIADAINEREYAYEVTGDALGKRVGVSDADRARYRNVIREQVGRLAAEYHFTPQP